MRTSAQQTDARPLCPGAVLPGAQFSAVFGPDSTVTHLCFVRVVKKSYIVSKTHKLLLKPAWKRRLSHWSIDCCFSNMYVLKSRMLPALALVKSTWGRVIWSSPATPRHWMPLQGWGKGGCVPAWPEVLQRECCAAQHRSAEVCVYLYRAPTSSQHLKAAHLGISRGKETQLKSLTLCSWHAAELFPLASLFLSAQDRKRCGHGAIISYMICAFFTNASCPVKWLMLGCIHYTLRCAVHGTGRDLLEPDCNCILQCLLTWSFMWFISNIKSKKECFCMV